MVDIVVFEFFVDGMCSFGWVSGLEFDNVDKFNDVIEVFFFVCFGG